MPALIVLFRRFDGGIAQAPAVVTRHHPLQRREERLEASPTNMLCLTAFPTPHDRMLRDGDCLRRPSRPRHPFSDNRVAERGSQMTLRAFGMPCSLPLDGVITPPAGKPPGPGPSGGHEKHPGLAAARLTFVFQRSVGAIYKFMAWSINLFD